MLKKLLVVLFMCSSTALFAQSVSDEIRYCGVKRDSGGRISRSSSVVSAFRKVHPCPVTGKTTGACPGWAVDHVIPLVCGGCDAVYNLQWLPNQIKSAGGQYPKDRWEQRVYCH